MHQRAADFQISLGENAPGPLPPASKYAVSVDQDQPAHTCSLILLHSLRRSINSFCQRNPIQCHSTN